MNRFLQGPEAKDYANTMIVVSKTSVVENWLLEELPKHIGPNVHWQAELYSTTSKSKVMPPKLIKPDTLYILLINDGCVRTDHGLKHLTELVNTRPCGIVVDESTMIKTPSTQITKKLLKLAEKTVWRRIASGEPAPQGPTDYFSQYKFLHHTIIPAGSFTAYKNIFVEQDEIWVAGRKIQKPTRRFTPIGKEIFEQAVRPYTIRLRKADVLQELPEKQYIKRVFQLPKGVRAAYDRLKKEFCTEIEQELKVKGQITATVGISRVLRLHQLVCGHAVTDYDGTLDVETGRFEVLCDILEERPDAAKTLIWAHYRASIDSVAAGLADKYGAQSVRRVYGNLSPAERQEAFQSFKTDPEVRFLVANPATAGWGLTFTEADACIYYCNSYNWEHRVQSEDRIHRIGQMSDSVSYYDIVAHDTVDEKILEILESKAEFSKSVLNNYEEWFK